MPTKKEVDKDLVLAIDWVAAEYKYLKLLIQDLERLQRSGFAYKEFSKARKLLTYISRAERRAYRLSKRVSKKFPKLIEDLEEELGESLELVNAINSFKEVAKELKVEHAHLIEYNDAFNDMVEEVYSERVKEKLQENHPKKVEEIHAAMLKIIEHFGEKVKEDIGWIRSLASSLEKAEELLKNLPEEHQKETIEHKIVTLNEWGFKIHGYPDYAIFLAEHWSDVLDMKERIKGREKEFFEYTLLLAKNSYEESGLWPILVEELPELHNLGGSLANYYWDLSWLGDTTLIRKETFPGIVRMLKESKDKDFIKDNIISVLKQLGPKLEQTNWDDVVDIFVDLGKVSDGLGFCFTGLVAVWDLFIGGIMTKEEIITYLPKLGEALREDHNARNFFGYGFPKIKNAIDRDNLEGFFNFFVYIAESKQKISKMVDIFNRLDEKSLPFLTYLILIHPKRTLDLLGNYHLLEVLEINFQQELDLFLKIATPITLKEKNFKTLTNIIIPLKDLHPRIRNLFLRYLNLSVETFQGVKIDFLKSLQATEGFEDISQYSFVDFVYIYLRYAQDPELKLKKLKKSLMKLQKEREKCLRLIANKKDLTELNDMNKRKLKSTLQSIGQMFFEPLLALYSESSYERFEKHLEEAFKVKIENIKDKVNNENFQNALIILKKLERLGYLKDVYSQCYQLIQNYLTNGTYPLMRNILNSFPWNLPKNLGWCKKRLMNKWWYKDFRKKYTISSEEIKETNIEERINHHLTDAKRIAEQLKLRVGELTIENIEAIYRKIAAKKDKYDLGLIADLKTQVDALRSLRGQELAAQKTGKKIIIQSEFDPLEVLQMGNHVAGSCLATEGSNFWSAVVNAVEVNKRILWAKDVRGTILGRVLIAVDENNNVVRFATYYATNVLLDRFFDEYIKELSKKCGFGINGDASKVKKILCEQWYDDGAIRIQE